MTTEGIENNQVAEAPVAQPPVVAPPVPSQPAEDEHQKLSKRASKQGCCIIIGVIILIVALASVAYFSNRESFNKLFSGQEKDTSRDPARARDYQYLAPTTEGQTRKIDCLDLYQPEHFSRKNPLCLNIYQTSVESLSGQLAAGNYDTLVLYGERIIIESDLKYANGNPIPADSLYNTAKFSDGVTVPKLMELFDLTNLNFVTIKLPTGKTILPYNALYVRITDSLKVAEACESIASGCALAWWSVILPNNIYQERHSYTRDHYRNYDTDKLSQTFSWPSNCYTDPVMLHEMSHILSYSSRTQFDWSKGAVLPKYFDEYLAGFVEDLGADAVCGAGVVNTTSNASGQALASNLVEYNSIYPPAELSHHHPTSDQACNLATINAFNLYLGQGNWQEQLGKFSKNLWTFVATSTTDIEQNFTDLIYYLNPSAKEFLLEHGCKL